MDVDADYSHFALTKLNEIESTIRMRVLY